MIRVGELQDRYVGRDLWSLRADRRGLGPTIDRLVAIAKEPDRRRPKAQEIGLRLILIDLPRPASIGRRRRRIRSPAEYAKPWRTADRVDLAKEIRHRLTCEFN